MFKDFDNSNSNSWGPLAGLKKEELLRVLARSNSKSAIKILSKQKVYKVTPIRSFTFEQEGVSFTVSADSDSMAHYLAEKQTAEYRDIRPDYSSVIPRVTTRYKITRT